MNAKDVKGILALLQTEYPSSFSKMDDQQKRAKINLWAELFQNDPAPLVYASVKAIIAGEAREFAPSAGEIKNKMHDLNSASEISETEAWAMVAKACRNGIYGYAAEFQKLPPAVQAAVGRPEQLREWAVMDVETLESVVASNFMRGYKTAIKRERELSLIPDDVRALLDSVGTGMALPEQFGRETYG